MQPSLFLEYYRRPGLALITGAVLLTILTLRRMKDAESSYAFSSEHCDGRLSAASSVNAQWMGDNWEQLKGLTLKQMILPGSHNSGNTANDLLVSNPVCPQDYRYKEYLSYGGTRSQEEFDERFISWNVNHFDGIPAQLQSGVRFFHLKLCWLRDSTAEAMRLDRVVHQHRGYTAMSMETLLDQFVDFLNTHPKEILLIGLNNMHQFQSKSELERLLDLIMRKVAPIQLMQPGQLLSSSLEDLIQSNSRIGIFVDCDHPGAILSPKYFVEDWGPEMHGGNLESKYRFRFCAASTCKNKVSLVVESLQWLETQVVKSNMEPLKYVVLQANPNNAEPLMYELIEKEEQVAEGTALFRWQLNFLRKLRPLLNNWAKARGGELALNVISTDFMEHSELVPLVLHDLMKLPVRGRHGPGS